MTSGIGPSSELRAEGSADRPLVLPACLFVGTFGSEADENSKPRALTCDSAQAIIQQTIDKHEFSP